MKILTLIFALTLNICFAFGQFKANSIGICYLQQDTIDVYNLTISFPFQTLTDQNKTQILDFKNVIDSIEFNGQITLFDKAGYLVRINNKDKFLLEFWCENDGGIQYRPTLRIKINKSDLKRPLNAISEIQNICCFAIIHQTDQKTDFTDLTITKDIKLLGDYDTDGNIDCLIWTDIDEAGNCDSMPPNDLRIMLQVGKQYYRMRCCGP